MPPPTKAVIEKTRKLYITNMRRYFTNLSEEDLRSGREHIRNANGVDSMKTIHEHFKAINSATESA